MALDDFDVADSFRTLSVQDTPILDHSLSHNYQMGSELFGRLVRDDLYDTNESKKKVKVIEFEAQEREMTAEWVGDEFSEELSGELRRTHPDVLNGRVNRKQIKVPDEVLKTINNKILYHQDPKKLRMNLSKLFVDLNETGIQQPSKDTSLEVDANIASFFTQNYGEIYQPLYELKKRVADFNPQRILDVGYGPATGMIALNEIMGDSFNPNLKHSFIIGSYEMQKRAKVLLSRQICEYNNVAEPESMDAESLEIDRMINRIDTGASHDIDTKKIKIKTKMISLIPETIKYDLIILSHQLLTSPEGFPLEIDEVLDEYLSHLAPNGHIVLVERGSPLGFETVARARQIVLRPENYQGNLKTPRLYSRASDIKPKNDDIPNFYLKVVAPCQHHGECPLQLKKLEPYNYGGKLSNKINWCHFQINIQRPKFLMELKKGRLMGGEWDPLNYGIAPKRSVGTKRSYANDWETVTYSYLVMQRSSLEESEALQTETYDQVQELGSKGDDIDSWPRVMKTPLKKKGMIVAEVCGPSGKLEKWIIPKSLGKQEYHDARKLHNGDLWPLDAKTKTESSRNSYKLMERIERKQENIQKKEKLTNKLEKIKIRKEIEAKQLALRDVEPNETNLMDRIDNMGAIIDLQLKQNPKYQKLAKNKYKY